MPQPKFCEACGALGAKLCCGRCHEAYYCNIVCQKKAWKKGHKSKCVPKTDKPPSAARAAPPPPAATAPCSSGDGGEECAICLDVLQQPQTMPCGHRFCRGCVASMRKHGAAVAQVCPLCRGAMPDAERLRVEAGGLLAQHDRWKKGQPRAPSPAERCGGAAPGGAPLPAAVQALLGKAAALLREALAIDPSDAHAQFTLGCALSGAGNNAGAEAAYRSAAAAAADPQHAALAHCNLGAALAERGDKAGAWAAFRATIAADPQNATAHYNLSRILYERGDKAGAEAANRAAIAADPQHADAHCTLGNLLNSRGDKAGAEAAIRAAIAADPQHAQAHGSLGAILNECGDKAGAEAANRAAIAFDPQFAGAHHNLGALMAERGDLAGAARSFAAALKIVPSNAQVKANLKLALRRQKEAGAKRKEPTIAARLLFGVIALLLVYYITAWVLGWVWYLLGWHTPAVAVPLVPEGLEGLEGLVGGLGEEAEAVDTAVEQSSGATAGGDPDDEFEF